MNEEREKRRYRKYTDQERSTVLADVVLIGSSAASVKYDIPRSTICTWQEQYGIVHNSALKRDRIGALIAAYLEANLQALTAQAYVVSQPDYIERQPAEGVGILHGIMADKSIRLIEAISRSQPDHPALDSE